MRISCALIGLNSHLSCCCKPTHETWEDTIGSLHNCLLESLKEFKMMTLKFVESKEGRVNKASGGPDELSKASCVRGCWAPWSADWLPLFFFASSWVVLALPDVVSTWLAPQLFPQDMVEAGIDAGG